MISLGVAPATATVNRRQNYTAQTLAYSTTANDQIVNISGTSGTITLHTAVGNQGQVITLIHGGTSLTQVYTINTTSSQTVGGIASGTYKLYTNGERLTLVSDNANWIILEHETATDWIDAGALTITGSAANPTKGSGTRDNFVWQRYGNGIKYFYEYNQTGGGSDGSMAYIFALPANLTMSGSVTNNGQSATDVHGSTIGTGRASANANAASSVSRHIEVVPWSTTAFFLLTTNNAAAADGFLLRIVGGTLTGIVTNSFGLSNTNSSFYAQGFIPIANWQP